ncbi:hypothetical protein [Actinomadura gamaensis]|uniref:Lytic transglycosylase domain-containing protein n=1 Tax=Actinomadura gamaensis TaxID=1763541 RepID=A0ABV9U6F7_9ACTN
MSTHRNTDDMRTRPDRPAPARALPSRAQAARVLLSRGPGGLGGRVRGAVRLAAVGTAAALVAAPLLADPVKSTLSAAERATGAAFHTSLRRSEHVLMLRDGLMRRAERNQALARGLMGGFGWRSDRQYRCLERLWTRESHWNERAHSPSGAYGIPQALPGSKMSAAGPGWQSNARTQIKWGLRYIRGRYGSPCGAWAHWQATSWY